MKRSWTISQSMDAFYNKLPAGRDSVCYEKRKE